jgi:hypothetical protein
MLKSAVKNDTVTAYSTVNQTPGGPSAGLQTVDLGSPTRTWADAQLAPYVCDTTKGAPGAG